MGEYGKHEAEGENKVALAIAEIKCLDRNFVHPVNVYRDARTSDYVLATFHSRSVVYSGAIVPSLKSLPQVVVQHECHSPSLLS